MRKMILRLTSIFSAVLISSAGIVCTGCGNMATSASQHLSESIAVIMSGCFGFPELGEKNIQPVYEEVVESYYGGTFNGEGGISIVTAEGAPQVYTTAFNKLSDGVTESKRQSEAELNTKSILRDAVSLKAESEEIDLLRAINAAAESVNSSQAAVKKIIIMANGISTSGVVDMTQGYYLKSPEAVATQLMDTHSIEDLTGIYISWIGLGSTALNSKQKISDSNRHDLEQFWNTILAQAGAASVDFRSDVITGECDASLPKVSVVTFPDVILTLDEEIEENTEVVKFNSILFEGDSAELLDWDEACATMQSAADLLISNPDCSYLVVGTTASTDGSIGISELSWKRAQACVDVLVSSGVNPDQITAVGLGNIPWAMRTVPDDEGYGLSPEQLEANRAANRAVYLIRSDCEIASEVLDIIQ